MKAKIDDQLICIPPFISSTWEQVRFLQSFEEAESQLFSLMIHLVDGKTVQVPNMDASLIDIAFAAHMKHLEKKNAPARVPNEIEPPKTFGGLLQQITGLTGNQLTNIPLRFGIAGVEGFPGMEITQHNLSLSNAPDIPSEIVEKITAMIKTLLQGDFANFPKPEPHCNCPHCQVARSIHEIPKTEQNEIQEETVVADEELKFREWDIVKQSDQLYQVTNPLDPRETYNVFLGTPVGCTCGEAHCAHIKAVLYS